MSDALTRALGVDQVVDRRHPPAELPVVKVNPEAAAEAIEAGCRVFQGTRDLKASILTGCIRMLQVMQDAAQRGARFPMSSGDTLPGIHPGDVAVLVEKLIFHCGGLAVEGPHHEEGVALALAAVEAAREKRALARLRDHRQAERISPAWVDEVGQRVLAHRRRQLEASGDGQ